MGYRLNAVFWDGRGTVGRGNGMDRVGGAGIGMVQSLPERGWRSRISLDGERIVR